MTPDAVASGIALGFWLVVLVQLSGSLGGR